MKENNNKFTMGEDKCIPPSPPSTTTNVQQNHKKHVRHHVKRRSSGRVHVAKLAPMIRANAQTDPETEQDEVGHRPTIRRSQSQRSLHRASFDRKGMTGFTQRRKSTASERPADTVSPPSTPPPPQQHIIASTPSSTRSSINPAHLTHQAVAAPVAQTWTAAANNLIIPDKKAAYPLLSTSPLTTSEPSARKQPLRSQFVVSSFDDGERARSTLQRSNTISRTQQKLMLQKQQAQVEDETSPIHPRNMQKLNRELELVGKEYRCVKRYQDPMRESLVRCLEKRTRPSATHSMSTLAVPTTIDVMIPHLEQREAAHKHHHLKTIALRRSVSCTQNTTESPALPFPWNATAFLERMFNHN